MAEFDFEQFFRDYGAARTDGEKLSRYFSEASLSAATTIAAQYREAGIAILIPSAVELLPLEQSHFLARVRWRATFMEARAKPNRDFRASYLLREQPHKVSILVAIGEAGAVSPANQIP